MTETEARRQYKREWAKRNREKMRESENRFYAKKAAEYEEAGEPASVTEERSRKLADIQIKITDYSEQIETLKNRQQNIQEEIQGKIDKLRECRRKQYATLYKLLGITGISAVR